MTDTPDPADAADLADSADPADSTDSPGSDSPGSTDPGEAESVESEGSASGDSDAGDSDAKDSDGGDSDEVPDARDEAGENAAEDTATEQTKSILRESAVLVAIAVTLYYLTLTFVARPYLIPSESMEPTLHGCHGCVGDRIVVDKMVYRFHPPQPGDVVVFRGPPSWNIGYRSIRSHNTAVRWVQNALSFLALVPPDENDLVKRVIAVGGQTVQCRNDTGLTVDGKPLNEPYLDPNTMKSDPNIYHCLGSGGGNIEFGPVTVPQGRLWMMGDNRTHSADSRAHCDNVADDTQRGRLCTGDDVDAGTVPVANVIGKARFIAWPPDRWGLVNSVNPQQGSSQQGS